MEELIRVLQEIENSDLPDDEDCVLQTHHHPMVETAMLLLEEFLIDEWGVRWANMDDLRAQGYAAFPVEIDSMGWLIGGVPTRKGTVLFG